MYNARKPEETNKVYEEDYKDTRDLKKNKNVVMRVSKNMSLTLSGRRRFL